MPYILISIIIAFFYLVFLYKLYISDTLPLKDVINNLTMFIGWIVVLLIALIQLKKTREDNQSIQREEFKKRLEIDAFKEINKAITNFYSILSRIYVKYLKLSINLSLSRNLDFMKIGKDTIDLLEGQKELSLSIESNEIAVIKFDHLRKYIGFRIEDVIDLIQNFEKEISKLAENDQSQFKKRCEDIYSKLLDVQRYLRDYRIELMNYFLGDIFPSKVSSRKPKLPYKTLTEVAIKEEVEKEAEKRERRALGLQE